MAWEFSPSNIKNTLTQHANQTKGVTDAMSGYLGGAKGSNFDYLQNMLKENINTTNPIFDQILGNYKRRVGSITDENVRKISEQAAQSGFRGTSANQINQAYKNQGEAVGSMTDNLAMKQLDWKEGMIRNLLGLNQFEGSTNAGLFNAALGQQNFNREMDFREDNTPDPFGQLLGNILGVGGNVLTAGFLSNWGSGNK